MREKQLAEAVVDRSTHKRRGDMSSVSLPSLGVRASPSVSRVECSCHRWVLTHSHDRAILARLGVLSSFPPLATFLAALD